MATRRTQNPEATAVWVVQHGCFADRPSSRFPDRHYHLFAFSLRHADLPLLHSARRLLGCGQIKAYPSLRDAHGRQNYVWSITGRASLMQVLVPFLDEHLSLMLPLRQAKYLTWRKSLLASPTASVRVNCARVRNAEINRKYRQSPRGKENARAYNRQYTQSEQGRAASLRKAALRRLRRIQRRYGTTSLPQLTQMLTELCAVRSLVQSPMRRKLEVDLACCRIVERFRPKP